MGHHRVLILMEEMVRCGGTAHAASGAATVHMGFSGEMGQEGEEGDALCVQELLVCTELLLGLCNRLGEALWVRVRGEVC